MQREQHGRCAAAERPNKKVEIIALSYHFHSVCGVYRQNIELFCKGFNGFDGFGGCYKILKLIKDVVVKTTPRGGIKIIHILAY